MPWLRKEKNIDSMAAAKSKAYEEKLKNGSFASGVTEQLLDENISKATKEVTTYLNTFEGKMDWFTGVAFVSFKNESMKNTLLQTYKYSSLTRFRMAFKEHLCVGQQKTGLVFQGNTLFIQQAAETLDVCWENLGLSNKEMYSRAILGQTLAVLVIIGCTILIYFLIIFQKELAKENPDDADLQKLVKYLNNFASLSLVAVNKFLSNIMPDIVAYLL